VSPEIRVSKPVVELRGAFARMLDDYDLFDPENGALYASARLNFDAYVQSLNEEEAGANLRSGFVPCSHRWLLDGAFNIVGVVRVRHNIATRFLAEEAGHIGYDVPPSFRRRGFGVACLKAGLAQARLLGLDRILVCADSRNIASCKIIERCGGALEEERFSPHYRCLLRRYWIEGVG
jgi:predicted acetyltransferase